MATKTKAKRKSTSKRKAAPKKRASKPQGIELPDHGFPAGAKVTVHHEHDETTRHLGGAPASKPLAKATVTKTGVLRVNIKDSGHYVAASEDDDGNYRYLIFAI